MPPTQNSPTVEDTEDWDPAVDQELLRKSMDTWRPRALPQSEWLVQAQKNSTEPMEESKGHPLWGLIIRDGNTIGVVPMLLFGGLMVGVLLWTWLAEDIEAFGVLVPPWVTIATALLIGAIGLFMSYQWDKKEQHPELPPVPEGPPTACKEALAALARERGWELERSALSMGRVALDLEDGTRIEIEPESYWALDANLILLPLMLESWARKDRNLQLAPYRFFSSDNALFDEFFPVRGVDREWREPERLARLLAPLHHFLERWSDRLGRMEIDESGVRLHLAPGHDGLEAIGICWVEAEHLEPLVDDFQALVDALAAIAELDPDDAEEDEDGNL